MSVRKLVSELNSIYIFHFIWWGCWRDQCGDEKNRMVIAMLVIFQLEGKESKGFNGKRKRKECRKGEERSEHIEEKRALAVYKQNAFQERCRKFGSRTWNKSPGGTGTGKKGKERGRDELSCWLATKQRPSQPHVLSWLAGKADKYISQSVVWKHLQFWQRNLN